MRRGVQLVTGGVFIGTAAVGLAFDNWPATVIGFWGIIWVTTWGST